MAFALTTTADASKLHGVKAMIYGGPGAGKTSLLATVPTPVIISAESGLLSLSPANIARLEVNAGRALPRSIPVIEVTTLQDLTDAFDWCARSSEAQNFETFCLDSLSEIAEKVLSNAKKKATDPRQAYGDLIEQVGDTSRKFRDLKGRNVLLIAKQEYIKDENTGRSMWQPAMPGSKLGQQLPYLFDEVLHLDIGRTPPDANGNSTSYRFLRTQPDYNYTAKDRSGTLDAIERPDIAHIFGKILGAK